MSTTAPLCVAILAAGKGTRMKSELPKVLHRLGSFTLIERVLQRVKAVQPQRCLVIVGHAQDQIRAALAGHDVEFVEQLEQKGTGHAIQQMIPYLHGFSGDLLVLSGDVPLLREQTLRALLQTHRQERPSATLLTANLQDPSGYGRVFCDDRQRVLKIIEHRDCTPEQRQNSRINSGTYCFHWPDLAGVLPRLQTHNQQQEYYLTDVIAHLSASLALEVEDEQEILGINDRLQLAQAYTFFQNQIKADWMRAGVTLVDPASITIDDEVQLEADVVIEPQTHLRGKTVIRSGCRIGPSSLVENSQIGRGCTIQFSVVSDSSIHDNSTVGPYAHVRMHSEIADQCRIGNFVEIKKTSMQSHTNAAHLAYLGDATIGSQVNIGAGTIIANYDGVQKHPTLIGDRSKTGANSVLVAPLQVGQDVTIAAGSTITADLPNDCLAIARAHQVIKPGWRLIRRDGHPSAPMPPAGKPGTMQVRVLRLTPNQDLKEALIQFCRDHAIQSGWILSAVGSLQQATLRFAGAVSPQVLQGHFEIITLAGTLSQEGVHLHSALADQQGTLIAGHLCSNSLIYTTAEIVMGESKDYRFSRELDPATGFAELVIQS